MIETRQTAVAKQRRVTNFIGRGGQNRRHQQPPRPGLNPVLDDRPGIEIGRSINRNSRTWPLPPLSHYRDDCPKVMPRTVPRRSAVFRKNRCLYYLVFHDNVLRHLITLFIFTCMRKPTTLALTPDVRKAPDQLAAAEERSVSQVASNRRTRDQRPRRFVMRAVRRCQRLSQCGVHILPGPHRNHCQAVPPECRNDEGIQE
jgi:hypothetical protein